MDVCIHTQTQKLGKFLFGNLVKSKFIQREEVENSLGQIWIRENTLDLLFKENNFDSIGIKDSKRHGDSTKP